MTVGPALEALIDSATTERAVLEWLKQEENAWILPPDLKVSPFGKYVVPEFCFGTDYRRNRQLRRSILA